MTTFVFTVDVETRTNGEPDLDIWGRVSSGTEMFGIEKIMSIFESYDVRATFFVNPYEVAINGRDGIAKAAKVIHSRGHDVELHTHPLPMYGYYGMSGAPLDVQRKILSKGISLIEGWTRRRPNAHRAGAFAANADTLKACSQLGLLADCSLSPGSKVPVPLLEQLGYSNVVMRIEGLVEIPVTYYLQMRWGLWRPRRILDIEGSSLPELKKVTQWGVANEIPTVTVLMHSFSLCRGGRPNQKVIGRLEAFLSWLRDREGVAIATVAEACRTVDVTVVAAGADGPPTTGVWLAWMRVLESWDAGWKNRAVAVMSVTGLVVGILGLVGLGIAWLAGWLA